MMMTPEEDREGSDAFARVLEDADDFRKALLWVLADVVRQLRILRDLLQNR